MTPLIALPAYLPSAGVIWGNWRLHTAFQHRGPVGVEPGSAGSGSFYRGK